MMEGTGNSNKRILLEYGYGSVLLGVVRCADQSAIDETGYSFRRTQSIAEIHDPELNDRIPRTLMHLQLIANLIEERKELWRDIELREQARREEGASSHDQDSMTSEDAVLFERLLELCYRISQVRKGELQTL